MHGHYEKPSILTLPHYMDKSHTLVGIDSRKNTRPLKLMGHSMYTRYYYETKRTRFRSF